MPYAHPSGFPPRSHDPRKKRTQTKALSQTEAWRGTGPRPTVSNTLFHRSAGACPPRSQTRAKNARKPKPFPKPRHGEGQALALRAAARFFIVARGPVPRDRQSARKPHANQSHFPNRGMARDRPSPYGKQHVVLTVARGLVPRERPSRPTNRGHVSFLTHPPRCRNPLSCQICNKNRVGIVYAIETYKLAKFLDFP